MGLLPTLGLTKYREVDLTVDDKNPFRVHTNTEKLLVVRERQREFKDFNKLEKEGLRVHEKQKMSRPTRRGVIRGIKEIQPLDERTRNSFDASGRLRAIRGPRSMAGSTGLGSDEPHHAGTKKISIFDQREGEALKLDKFAKLGYLD